MSAVSPEQHLIEKDVEAYLARHEKKELLRFVAVGSVDDGKSTLIGRLLHDTHGVYEDQLSAVKRASATRGATREVGKDPANVEIDFSLFTDGLKAEREQGITIDVAYRYFSTEKRKFIIADTPGHVQYTRNMATGASTADVAIILIDARLGVLQQSRRHAYIASLLGIPHLLVGVNKMDLRGWDRAVFDAIRAELERFTSKLAEVAGATPFQSVTFVPISALKGDNIVHTSTQMAWYDGPTLLQMLETIPIGIGRASAALRYPVQYVIRPNLAYRGYAAQIASGTVNKGDELMVLPSRRRSRVVAIDTFDGEREQAFAPMSVALRLADEIDISRGDMLVHATDMPRIAQRIDATVVWLGEKPLDPGRSYLLKHTTQMVRVEIEDVAWVTDPESLAQVPAKTLALNDIGRLALRCHRPIYCDAYTKNRGTGAFVLIDSLTNDTVGAGMILDDGASPRVDGLPDEAHVGGTRSQVSAAERRERLGQSGACVMITAPTLDEARGLAFLVERQLFDVGAVASVVEAIAIDEAMRATAAAGVIAIGTRVAAGKSAVAIVSQGGERAIELDAITDREAAARLVVDEIRAARLVDAEGPL